MGADAASAGLTAMTWADYSELEDRPETVSNLNPGPGWGLEALISLFRTQSCLNIGIFPSPLHQGRGQQCHSYQPLLFFKCDLH
jgi:hypothetical protein